MIDNKTAWNNYKEHTNNLSKLLRHLAFAAAGICWFFKTAQKKSGEIFIIFPELIVWSFFFTIGYFLFDILQHFVSAESRRIWIEKKEIGYYKRTGSIDGDYTIPRKLTYLPRYLSYMKISSLVISFVFLIYQCYNQLGR